MDDKFQDFDEIVPPEDVFFVKKSRHCETSGDEEEIEL
jgi:hypothetical protein